MRAANCMRDYGTTNNTPAHQAPPVWRAPEGLEDLAAVPVGGGGAAPLVWRTPEGPAAVLVGGGRAWPGFEIDHSERSSRVAISRAGRRPPAHTAARPNKTSHAAAGPGRASRRHAEPIISTPGATGVEDTGGNCRGAGGRWWRRTAGVEDTGGPGRGAGGRRQGLAGLRDDTPSAARGPDGERAGRRPPAPTRRHKHSATNT